MVMEKVREGIHANPFASFLLRLAGGGTIPAIHSDFVSSSPAGRVLHIFHAPRGALTFVDVLPVIAPELNPKTRPARSA